MIRTSNLLRVASFLPIAVAFTLVQIAEPFPHGWLAVANPHFWPNALRMATYLFAGVVLGMITYTLLLAINAERTVSGGHPRQKLYRHVTLIAISHGLLIASLLFYIRDQINRGLSPATPVVVVGLAGTFVALAKMLSYQNSRLCSIHAAKQMIGVIEPADGEDHDLCVRIVGSVEPVRLADWIAEFRGGVVARMSIEKVEEIPEAQKRGFASWLWRNGGLPR